MYSASSSLRAWTLRLPSVVFISFLRSLKLSESLTASALTMPSRRRSWISLSSASARAEDTGLASGFPRTVRKSPVTPGRRSSRAVPCLATVPPRKRNPEAYVQTAESRRHYPVVPRLRRKKSERSGQHEAESHYRHHLDRERSAGHHGRTIEKQPRSGNRVHETGPVEDDGEESSDQDGRREAQYELPAGTRYERNVRSARFSNDCPQHYHRREHCRGHPDVKRLKHRLLRRPNRGCHRRDHPYRYHSPAGDGRKRPGSLHRVTDERKVVHCAHVKRGRLWCRLAM